MAYIKDLITDKILNNKNAVQSQRLAVCMAWQILNDYPNRQKPKEWQIYNNLRGVMLADEVGGGKTFETLAVISKALLEETSNHHSKDRFRVLIIANPSIRSKWEWREDESLTFEDFYSENYEPKCDIAKFIKQTNLNKPTTQKLFTFFSSQVFISKKVDWQGLEKSRQGIWLTSFQSLPTTEGFSRNSAFKKGYRQKELFPNNFFDYIIVDEAHSLKSGSKDVDEAIKLDGSAVRKIYAVINSSPQSKVLLLTATPFQNDKSELKHLLQLLEKSDEYGVTDLISDAIDELEKQFFNLKTEEFSIDKIKSLSKNFNHDINAFWNEAEEDRYKRPAELKNGNDSRDGLDDFMRDIMIRNTKEPLHIKPVIAQLSEAEKFQYLLYRDLIKTSEEESQMFSTKLSQMVSSRESFIKSNINAEKNNEIENLFKGNLVFEAKYNKLLETIENIELSNNKNVISVFVSWLETVDILKVRLEKKYKIYTLTGDTPTDERSQKLENIKKENEKTNKKIILIVSRVGNEGLDFDKFSNRIIHYDNNFNPAVIDQRNGRVYRGSNIGTKGKKVTANDIEVYQLFIEESYDQRILFIEQEKRKMKNFYLGDGSLQKILEKTIEKNNLAEEKEILKIIDSIKIDLTPSKKYILPKYKNEISE
jgi:superfamily II DNA or RNA helicase